MNVCPECGGNLKFDPNHKRYVCQSCGLAVTKEEIEEIRAKDASSEENDKEQRRKDYLKWWSTKK